MIETPALQGKQSIDCLNTMLGRRGANYGCKMEASLPNKIHCHTVH